MHEEAYAKFNSMSPPARRFTWIASRFCTSPLSGRGSPLSSGARLPPGLNGAPPATVVTSGVLLVLARIKTPQPGVLIRNRQLSHARPKMAHANDKNLLARQCINASRLFVEVAGIEPAS